MKSRITLADVMPVLVAVAAEDPDHIDERVGRHLAPRYLEHGQPCCLVAVVLLRLGFTTSQLKQLDREGTQHANTSSGGAQLGRSRHPLLRRIDPIALDLLDYVQARQDRGAGQWSAWGYVVDEALGIGQCAADYLHKRTDKPWLTHVKEILHG